MRHSDRGLRRTRSEYAAILDARRIHLSMSREPKTAIGAELASDGAGGYGSDVSASVDPVHVLITAQVTPFPHFAVDRCIRLAREQSEQRVRAMSDVKRRTPVSGAYIIGNRKPITPAGGHEHVKGSFAVCGIHGIAHPPECFRPVGMGAVRPGGNPGRDGTQGKMWNFVVFVQLAQASQLNLFVDNVRERRDEKDVPPGNVFVNPLTIWRLDILWHDAIDCV